MYITNKLLKNFVKSTVEKEWNDLSLTLISKYEYYKNKPEFRPPIIAQHLLISGEDHRFFYHPGFDIIAICRAIFRRMVFNIIEGASTIDQQLVRVLTGRYERTIKRKWREICLAILLTSIVPKEELPGLYLSIAYFGWHMNNFKEACEKLHLNPSTMTMKEAAELVARLKYPEPSQPSKKRIQAIRRRGIHLMKLYKLHVLDSTYNILKLQMSHASI
jgi:membrane peptidoglycan carboxypeptidase